jgi:hypothetical protein
VAAENLEKEAEAADEAERAARKSKNDARSKRMRKTVLKLASFRFIKLVPGTTVDDFKAFHAECNNTGLTQRSRTTSRASSARLCRQKCFVKH